MMSKHTAIRGFTLIEMLISVGIGAVGIAVMGQLFTTTAKQGMKSQRLNTKNSLDDLLSAFLMTSTDCGIALGLRVLNPATRPVPDPFSTATTVDEPSPLLFVISGLSGSTVSAPVLNISPLSVAIHDSLGTKVIAPGLTYQGIHFTESPTLTLNSSSPLNITGQGSYLSYQTRGTLNLKGTRVGTAESYSFSKVLSINLSIIPSGTDLNTSTFKGKILKCSSLDLGTPGAPLLNKNAPGGSPTGDLQYKVSLPNSTGAPSYLLSVCPFQQYMDNYNLDASVSCSEASTSGASDTSCTEPGYGYVLIPNANSVLVPTCVLISCPDGQLPTALDSNGFIQSCDLSSNFFVPCKARGNFYNATSSSSQPIIREDYYCPATHDKDLKAKPPSHSVCIEDCSVKHHDACGQPLRDNTYSGPLARGHLSIDCSQGTDCARAEPPDCKVNCSNGNFSGYDSGTNTCKSKETECWSWSLYQNDYDKKPCGSSNPTVYLDDSLSNFSKDDCLNKYKGDYPNAIYEVTVEANDDTTHEYIQSVYCYNKHGCGSCMALGIEDHDCGCRLKYSDPKDSPATCSRIVSNAYCY